MGDPWGFCCSSCLISCKHCSLLFTVALPVTNRNKENTYFLYHHIHFTIDYSKQTFSSKGSRYLFLLYKGRIIFQAKSPLFYTTRNEHRGILLHANKPHTF